MKELELQAIGTEVFIPLPPGAPSNIPAPLPVEQNERNDMEGKIHYSNIYNYWTIPHSETLYSSIGFSYVDIEDEYVLHRSISKINPKLGISWHAKDLHVNAAAFSDVARYLPLTQSLEPVELPIGIKYRCNRVFNVEVTSTYVHQKTYFDSLNNMDKDMVKDSFWYSGFSLEYRLPKAMGAVSVDIRNFTDEKFTFQKAHFLRFVLTLPRRQRFFLNQFVLILRHDRLEHKNMLDEQTKQRAVQSQQRYGMPTEKAAEKSHKRYRKKQMPCFGWCRC